MPAAATRVVPPRGDLPASPALSIMRSRPRTFRGRKLGALVTDGVDAGFLRQLETVFNDVGATLELIAPAIGGVKTEDGAWLEAKRTIATAPSVLFDAVALVVAPQASKEIAKNLLAATFVADAFAHSKFIAYTADARPLLERALGGAPPDGGCKQVETPMAAAAFAALCGDCAFRLANRCSAYEASLRRLVGAGTANAMAAIGSSSPPCRSRGPRRSPRSSCRRPARAGEPAGAGQRWLRATVPYSTTRLRSACHSPRSRTSRAARAYPRRSRSMRMAARCSRSSWRAIGGSEGTGSMSRCSESSTCSGRCCTNGSPDYARVLPAHARGYRATPPTTS